MTSRKAALDKFVLKLINHSILSQSEELKSFLTDRDEKYEEFKTNFEQVILQDEANKILQTILFTD
jgi:hypothetical protein